MKRPPMNADPRPRTFPEARIVDYLLVSGWATAARGSDREQARAEARAALERWIAAGLPVAGAADGARHFDPAEVLNFGKWAGMQRADPFYEERFVAQSRDLVRAFHSASAAPGVPPSPSDLPPRRFEVTLEREFDLRRAPSGARTLLRMPLPIEDDMCRDLDVQCSAPPGCAVEFTRAPGRVDARFAAPSAATLALTVRASFIAHPGVADPRPQPLSLADRDLYTRPVEGLVRVSPAVRTLAERLARNATDPWAAVRSFWNFILDELACGVVDYSQLDPAGPLDYVLASGWFDCQTGSALLVALCRSRGIPARIVSGYLLYADSPSVHWWVEVALPDRGWIPLDTLASDLSARGRDTAWRDYFAGAVDYRMKCECLPRVFGGSPGFRLPDAWRMLWRADGEATEIGLYACDHGELVYRDRIVVRT